MTSDEDLMAKAVAALPLAYCRYSKFPVAAALLCKDGTVFTGVNVENASYGGTICAERSAYVAAVSQGKREFLTIAIATELEAPAAPCGICRQFMNEFGNIKVILGSSKNCKTLVTTIKELLPHSFGPTDLSNHATELAYN
ncbi:unnamed protein product, partial [Mesorhabditis belari]|uniref:Cytidine deaminase n=1 Tax=Mesorhabditis belari TaxID=2138241 RepID=A0AAF3FLM1_9BILA